MRNRILTVAVLFMALADSIVAAQTLPAKLGNTPAPVVLGRILAGRDQLGLSAAQVAQLTALEEKLRNDRGRPVIPGLDRVPGKSVPRIERRKTTAVEAFRQASALLTTEQQANATRLLETPGR